LEEVLVTLISPSVFLQLLILGQIPEQTAQHLRCHRTRCSLGGSFSLQTAVDKNAALHLCRPWCWEWNPLPWWQHVRLRNNSQDFYRKLLTITFV